MPAVSLKDAEADLAHFVDEANKGRSVTITRDGKPVAASVSVEAAGSAHRAMGGKRPDLSPT